MDVYMLCILFYVPSMFAVILLIVNIIRSFGQSVNLCLINLTVTSLAEIIRVTALVIPKGAHFQQIPFGQGIVEHVIHVSWKYSLILYFAEQAYCMKNLLGRRKIPARLEGVAVLGIWILILIIALPTAFTGYNVTQGTNYHSRRRISYGVYLDDVSPYGLDDIKTQEIAMIIELVCYNIIPLIALATIATVAYRRWYAFKQEQFKCAASNFISARGHEVEATPSGIEMVRVDNTETKYQITITPVDSSARFEWMMRMVSLNWFCPSTFVLLSLGSIGLWLSFDYYRSSFVPHFLGGIRFFTYLGALSLAHLHDDYLRNRS